MKDLRSDSEVAYNRDGLDYGSILAGLWQSEGLASLALSRFAAPRPSFWFVLYLDKTEVPFSAL